MKHVRWALLAAALVLSGCSYHVGYSMEIGTEGELLSITMEIGVGEDTVDMMLETIPEDIPDEEAWMLGFLRQDTVSDEEFQTLVEQQLDTDQMIGMDIPIDTVETDRWVTNDGTKFMSIKIVPGIGYVPQGTDPTGLETSVLDGGAVRAEIEAEGIFGSATDISGGDIPLEMMDVTISFEVAMPHPIVDTNGDVTADDDPSTAYWVFDATEDTPPDVLYAETEAPSSGMWTWIMVGVLALLALSIFSLARRKKRKNANVHN